MTVIPIQGPENPVARVIAEELTRLVWQALNTLKSQPQFPIDAAGDLVEVINGPQIPEIRRLAITDLLQMLEPPLADLRKAAPEGTSTLQLKCRAFYVDTLRTPGDDPAALSERFHAYPPAQQGASPLEHFVCAFEFLNGLLRTISA
jgi:hypothetical protein